MDKESQLHERHVMDNQVCCGCALCAAKCPVAAITMKQDNTGFWRPEIDFSLCLNCGMCMKTCEALHQRGMRDVAAHDSLQAECVASWVNEREEVLKSSSGGILTALAKKVIRQGGVVSAAGYGDGMVPSLMVAQAEREVEAMAGSKYVQCRNVPEHFHAIKGYLKEGRRVLFIGTPCQVSALNAYIGKETHLLLTADFLCHGTPSPLLLQKYMEWRGKLEKSRMVDMGFRGKTVQGWMRSSIDCHFESGKVLRTRIDFDPFYGFFSSQLAVNNSCFACRYASLTRMADITVMDYWHAPQSLLQERRYLGMSLVLMHTDKGREIMHELQREGIISTRDADLASYYRCQPAFCHAADKPARWEEFMRELPKRSFPELAAKYLPKRSWKYTLKGKLKWHWAKLQRMLGR